MSDYCRKNKHAHRSHASPLHLAPNRPTSTDGGGTKGHPLARDRAPVAVGVPLPLATLHALALGRRYSQHTKYTLVECIVVKVCAR